MSDIVTITLGACVLSYAVAVVMPTWRWLLGMTLVVAVLVASDWSRHWIIPSLGISKEDPFCLVAIMLLFVASVGFAVGVVVRGLTLLLRSRGVRRRSIVMVCVVGAAIAPAIITFAPDLVTWPGSR